MEKKHRKKQNDHNVENKFSNQSIQTDFVSTLSPLNLHSEMAHEPNDLEISTVHNSVSNLSNLKLLDEVACEPNDSINFRSSETSDIISTNYEEYRCETVYTLNNTPTQKFKIKKSKKTSCPTR